MNTESITEIKNTIGEKIYEPQNQNIDELNILQKWSKIVNLGNDRLVLDFLDLISYSLKENVVNEHYSNNVVMWEVYKKNKMNNANKDSEEDIIY